MSPMPDAGSALASAKAWQRAHVPVVKAVSLIPMCPILCLAIRVDL